MAGDLRGGGGFPRKGEERDFGVGDPGGEWRLRLCRQSMGRGIFRDGNAEGYPPTLVRDPRWRGGGRTGGVDACLHSLPKTCSPEPYFLSLLDAGLPPNPPYPKLFRFPCMSSSHSWGTSPVALGRRASSESPAPSPPPTLLLSSPSRRRLAGCQEPTKAARTPQ